MYSAEIAERVPGMFRILCICFTIFAIIAIILVQRNPEFVKTEKRNLEQLNRLTDEEKEKLDENLKEINKTNDQ